MNQPAHSYALSFSITLIPFKHAINRVTALTQHSDKHFHSHLCEPLISTTNTAILEQPQSTDTNPTNNNTIQYCLQSLTQSTNFNFELQQTLTTSSTQTYTYNHTPSLMGIIPFLITSSIRFYQQTHLSKQNHTRETHLSPSHSFHSHSTSTHEQSHNNHQTNTHYNHPTSTPSLSIPIQTISFWRTPFSIHSLISNPHLKRLSHSHHSHFHYTSTTPIQRILYSHLTLYTAHTIHTNSHSTLSFILRFILLPFLASHSNTQHSPLTLPYYLIQSHHSHVPIHSLHPGMLEGIITLFNSFCQPTDTTGTCRSIRSYTHLLKYSHQRF